MSEICRAVHLYMHYHEGTTTKFVDPLRRPVGCVFFYVHVKMFRLIFRYIYRHRKLTQ